ncbi:organomercurial lyase [Streptomyces xantholiticus]
MQSQDQQVRPEAEIAARPNRGRFSQGNFVRHPCRFDNPRREAGGGRCSWGGLAKGFKSLLDMDEGRLAGRAFVAAAQLHHRAGDPRVRDLVHRHGRHCDVLNFFANRSMAETWARRHPDVLGRITSQAEAVAIARQTFGPLLAED